MAKTFSVEDGNLSSSIIKSSRARISKDIDLTFTAKPSGEIFKKQDAAAVKQAIKNLMLTNFGEKPFNPLFGANLRALLFELADPDTEYDIERAVINAIEAYEPRASILNVTVKSNPDGNEVKVNIVFRLISTSEEVTFTTTLARLR
jgi:phage baseplate assembly protein W